MKDAYYFTHDSNARNDPKISAMRSVYGATGYGWFWMIVEILREQNEYDLIVDGYFYASLAMQLHEDEAKIKGFLDDCVNKFHLFTIKDNRFFSLSLKRRLQALDQKKELARKAANIRWESTHKALPMPQQSVGNADALRAQCAPNAIREEEEEEIRVDNNSSSFTTGEIEKNMGAITTTYESEIGQLTPMIADQLKEIAVDTPALWFKEACLEAVQNNARSLKYIRAILDRWKIDGFKTLKKNGNGKGNGHKEVGPDYWPVR